MPNLILPPLSISEKQINDRIIEMTISMFFDNRHSDMDFLDGINIAIPKAKSYH